MKELDEEQKAIYDAARARVNNDMMRREKWNSILVRMAKATFESMIGVKKGDVVNYTLFSRPEKVIYDDVCMDEYGNLKVRCYHLKKDGNPRKIPSMELWCDFYKNKMKSVQSV